MRQHLVMILLPCIVGILYAEARFIPNTEQPPLYTINGIQCEMCPPGKYVSSDCMINNTQSTCSTCRRGTFNPEFTEYIACNVCTVCAVGKTIVKDCTPTTDTNCSACAEGYEERSGGQGSGTYCGEIVIQPTADLPSQIQCFDQYYLDAMNKTCQPCTNCTNILQPCNQTHDTVCEDTTNLHDNRSSYLWTIVISVVLAVGVIVIAVVAVKCLRKQKEQRKLEHTEPASAEMKTPNVQYHLVR